MKDIFLKEVESALESLRNGKVLLYPTDTIWGLGCDALNENAVKKIYNIKGREDSKSMIILMADEREVLKYVAAPDLAVFDFLEKQDVPTTIIFDSAIGLPESVIADDGSIAIRITGDEFCRHLIKRLQKPIISTSANKSGHLSPKTFADVTKEIIDSVDKVVNWRQDDLTPSEPSQIIKWNNDGSYKIIRGAPKNH